MSLIHDALKSMDAPQQDPKLVLARAPVEAPRRRPAWLDAALAFAIVVGAGVVGWLTWQSQVKPRADLTPMAVAPVKPVVAPVALPAVPAETAVTAMPAMPAMPADTTPTTAMPVMPALPEAAVTTAPAAATVTPTQPAAPVNVAMQSTVPVAPRAPAAARNSTSAAVVEPAAMPAPPVARVQPRPAAQRNARSGRPAAPPAEAAPAVTPVVDETPVELRFARFVTAMKEGRSADAERELAGLKERLPAGSLGLLRAQAWYDLRAGRDGAAAVGYRAIIERMPGDEEAAINLASIQARQQKPEEARATLDAAVRLQPDSAALRAALAQFTPAAR